MELASCHTSGAYDFEVNIILVKFVSCRRTAKQGAKELGLKLCEDVRYSGDT
jgi:hypothetical protein